MYRETMIKSLYVPPKCHAYWEKRFPDYDFNWNIIWRKLLLCTNEARLISLTWKILHNIYPTKTLLFKMGKEDTNVCIKCNVIDYVDHFFFSCKNIKHVWEKVNFIVSQRLNKNISLSVTDVLFGVHDKSINRVQSIFIHNIISVAKLCIGKFRYGNHPNLLFLFEHELALRQINL